MRDTRFDLDRSVSWSRHRSIEQGRLVEREPWFTAGVVTLRDWYQYHMRDAQIDDAESYVLAPDDELRMSLSSIAAMPSDLVSALMNWSSNYNALGDDPEAGWMWGTALAQAGVALITMGAAFEHSWRTAARRAAAGEAYLDVLAAALGGEFGPTVLSMMRTIVDRARTLQGCFVPGHRREQFPSALKKWRDEAQFFDLWQTRALQEFGANCDEMWLLDAMRRHDRRLYLESLEDTANPLSIQEALGVPAIVEDIEEILALLADAPAAATQSASGPAPNEWTHRLTAALLLEIVLAHAERLIRLLLPVYASGPSTPQAQALIDQDLPDRFHRVLETILTRDDGTFLAIHWILHLAHILAHSQWPTPRSAADLAVPVIAEALVRRNIGETAFRAVVPDVFRQLESGAPRYPHVNDVDVLLALVAMNNARPDRDAAVADNARLLALLNALLIQNGSGLTPISVAGIPTWCHVYGALLFLRTQHPHESWRASWDLIKEQRRKLFYRAYTRDLSADIPSLFAMCTGIAALLLLHDDDVTESAATLAFWQQMYEASLSMVLRLGSWGKEWARADEWRRILITLIGLLPRVAQRSNDTFDDSALLSTVLRRQGGDDELVINSIVRLYENAVPSRILLDAIAQAEMNLEEIVNRYSAFLGVPGCPVAIYDGRNALAVCQTILRTP